MMSELEVKELWSEERNDMNIRDDGITRQKNERIWKTSFHINQHILWQRNKLSWFKFERWSGDTKEAFETYNPNTVIASHFPFISFPPYGLQLSHHMAELLPHWG